LKYSKPHLPYDQQLQRLVDRGLTYSDQSRAVRSLQHIGYYRLSAYTYPFREFSPVGADERPAGPRPDTFQAASTFEDAVALHDFDQRLRRCLAAGLEEVEIGLRTQIAYTLGKRDPFGHLDRAALADDLRLEEFQAFSEAFDRQRAEARDEEFVKHFILKYEGDMPIWVAAEVMSFGLLVRLYSLLKDRDASSIAATLGVRDRRPSISI
jgi:abortive infection bacteriophage resistance protein